ncbi:PTS sugar transporter subunit IIB [Clostridium botulinum]|nr:PTS sugar transporter subunit IIB [Clostridium botulinum]
MNILTVCGNGIGSSLMLAMKIEEICKENGIAANVESTDFNSAQGKKADLIVTVKELAEQFEGRDVAVVRSYINKKKITEDVLEIIKQKDEELKKIGVD